MEQIAPTCPKLPIEVHKFKLDFEGSTHKNFSIDDIEVENKVPMEIYTLPSPLTIEVWE